MAQKYLRGPNKITLNEVRSKFVHDREGFPICLQVVDPDPPPEVSFLKFSNGREVIITLDLQITEPQTWTKI